MFPVESKSESITPAKFQLDRVKIVRDMQALIPIWPLPPKIAKKKFFVRSKKFLLPVLSGGKDITPAKFQLNRFITVGGVDGQTHTQTHIPGPYVNYSKILANYASLIIIIPSCQVLSAHCIMLFVKETPNSLRLISTSLGSMSTHLIRTSGRRCMWQV